MLRKFEELRSRMSPEAQAAAKARADEILRQFETTPPWARGACPPCLARGWWHDPERSKCLLPPTTASA